MSEWGEYGPFSTMSLSFEAKQAYAMDFLPVSKFREVTRSQEAAEEKKNKHTKTL